MKKSKKKRKHTNSKTRNTKHKREDTSRRLKLLWNILFFSFIVFWTMLIVNVFVIVFGNFLYLLSQFFYNASKFYGFLWRCQKYFFVNLKTKNYEIRTCFNSKVFVVAFSDPDRQLQITKTKEANNYAAGTFCCMNMCTIVAFFNRK